MFNDKFTVSVKGNVANIETVKLRGNETATNFSIAVNESYKDRSDNQVETVNFINCSVYGKTEELFNRFCQKGTRILLENQNVKFGRDKDTGKANGRFNIVVRSFEVLKNGKPKESTQAQPNQGGYQAQQQQGGYQAQPNQGGYQGQPNNQYMTQG